MPNIELFKEWMQYADEDRQMAEFALDAKGPANQICFEENRRLVVWVATPKSDNQGP